MCWVFVSVQGLSLVAASGGHSSSRCAGLSLSRPLVAEHRLQMRRLSSCGSRAHLLRGMWDLPRPGLEPVSPALGGRFSTTAPPGKPYFKYFLSIYSGPGITDKQVILLSWSLQSSKKSKNNRRKYFTHFFLLPLAFLKVDSINHFYKPF